MRIFIYLWIECSDISMNNFNDVFFLQWIFFCLDCCQHIEIWNIPKKTPSFKFYRICMGCKTNAFHWHCLHGLGGSAANHNEPCPNVVSYLHCRHIDFKLYWREEKKQWDTVSSAKRSKYFYACILLGKYRKKCRHLNRKTNSFRHNSTEALNYKKKKSNHCAYEQILHE